MSIGEAADFLDTGHVREEQRGAAVEYAQLYTDAFVRNPAGAKLLREWETRILKKKLPIGSSHVEYAAAEAVRQFILGINEQIVLAQTEGR